MTTNTRDPKPVPTDERLLLGPNDAALSLGISPRLLFSLARSGAIPVVRIHRRTLYDPADLWRFIATRKSA